MLRRLASSFTAASLLATALWAAAPADAASGFLAVTVRESGYVDFTLPQAITIDLATFEVPKARDVGGFFMQRAGERFTASGDHSAAFFVRGLAGPDDPHGSVTMAFGKKTLPAGRYRLNVIADAPMTLTIPLASDFTRRLRVSRSLSVKFDASPVSATAAGQVATDRPISVGPTSTVISVAGAYSSAGATLQDLAACSVTPAQAEAAETCPNGSFPGVTTSTGLTYGVGVIATYGPGQLSAGSAIARGRVLAIGSIRRIVTGVVVFSAR